MKLDRDKKNPTYFLMRDILSCIPDKVERNLVGTLNRHLVSKEITRQILREEILEKEPHYRILAGGLILQNNFLRQLPQVAFYEVIEIIEVLKYCFKEDPRKTLNKLSAQTILRLFVTLYFEFRILPLDHKEDEIYINQFKKCFSKKDILEIINTNGYSTRFIFEQHGMDLGTIDEMNVKLKTILNKF